MIKDPDMDQTRMASYPNLEYHGIYNAICMLVSWSESLKWNVFWIFRYFFQIDVAPNIQYGVHSELTYTLLAHHELS